MQYKTVKAESVRHLLLEDAIKDKAVMPPMLGETEPQ